jgi:hypothetical protein
MSIPEPAEESDQPGKLPKPIEVPVPATTTRTPRSYYWVLPLVSTLVIYSACAGYSVSFTLICVVPLFTLIFILLMPHLSWHFKQRVTILCLLGVLSAIPFELCVLPIFDSIRRPAWWQEYSLLRLTPPGTPRSEVQALIKRKSWGGRFVYFGEKEKAIPEIQRNIDACLGSYHTAIDKCFIYATWFFDEEGKVTRVEVTGECVGFL